MAAGRADRASNVIRDADEETKRPFVVSTGVWMERENGSARRAK